MRRMQFVAVVATVGLFGSMYGAVHAAPPIFVAEISDSVGDPQLVEVPNTAVDMPFTFNITLDIPFDTGSAQLKIESLSGNGIFELTGATFGPLWQDTLGFTGGDLLALDPNGQSSQLIGGGPVNASSPVPAGVSLFASIDALVKAGTPAGDYPLNLNSILGTTFDAPVIETEGFPGADYVVRVLPEPATLGLFGAALLFCRRRR